MNNLAPKRRRWMRVRIVMLAGVLFVGAGAVAHRAWELQIDRAPVLREMAEEQYLRRIRLAPKRGTIYDRHGAELAVSVDVDSVWANPRELREEGGNPSQIATQLSAMLGVDRERIETRLSSDRYFVWIKRRISPRLAGDVRRLELPGVHMEREARRFYPNGPLASHILGFANIDGVGIEGLELSLEEQLHGSVRAVPAIRDRRGRVVFSEQLLDDRAAQGDDVSLTLDKTIQRLAERELALAVQTFEARSGSVVVMDPHSGELLAVANFPTFDPNRPGSSPPSHRRNRAVTDRFEPGSTVKPFTVAAALASGTIGPEQSIDCLGGSMIVDDQEINDTTPHDDLTPAQILAFSSNIGAAKIGGTLGRRGLYRAFRRFGFGETTGLPLPGEVGGVLRHYRQWYEMDAVTIAFGQGMSVTSVQLATAMSVIANGGQLVEPRLLRHTTDAHGEIANRESPRTRRRVVPERVARLVADMLTAVTGPGGTAEEAAIDGYLTAGKTGTAQKADVIRGGYSEDRWLASFVGFVPADNPRLVISVVVDEPIIAHYGGIVAGPVFRRVGEGALRHLGVPAADGGDALAEISREHTRRRRVLARQARRARRGRRSQETASEVVAMDTPGENEALVPDLSGQTARAALVTLSGLGLRVAFEGRGVVQSQLPAPGTVIPRGERVRVELAPAYAELDAAEEAAIALAALPEVADPSEPAPETGGTP
ncbi:MAG: penicillin-binding protein [Myxococcota bacterium]